MNHYLAVQAPDEFHPEFYVTVATVLPLLLLVANLLRVYLSQRREVTLVGIRLSLFAGLSFPGAPGLSSSVTMKNLWPHMLAISMASLNVISEVTCLIVLFLRRGGTVTSVIIWVGLGCSMAWTLLLLSTYIVNTPIDGDTPGHEE